MHRRAVPALLAAGVGLAAASVSPASADRAPRPLFTPAATFAVDGDVAEILAVTPDGRTVLYTDSSQQRIGFVDLADPSAPVQTGTLAMGGEPTSVAVTGRGRYAVVAVDTTAGRFTTPSGALAVVDLRTRSVVHRLDLGGQPDSVAVSPDGRVAAVAVENQRDEELVVDGVEGGLPQPPAGYLAVVRLQGPPARWRVDRVDLTGLPGAAFADDPEPEYVDVDRHHRAAVTLQENNAVVVVDLDRLEVTGSFSAGTVERDDADVVDDGIVAFDDRLVAPREPDGVQWTREGNLLTADEGDLAAEPSGGRGWSVFRPDGRLLHTSGAAAEKALAAVSRYPDSRSDDKGAELEGAEVTRLGDRDLAVLGSERGDAVLVYDVDDERRPVLLQVLATGDSPEGILAVPRRGLLLTANEGDGTISVFRSR